MAVTCDAIGRNLFIGRLPTAGYDCGAHGQLAVSESVKADAYTRQFGRGEKNV